MLCGELFGLILTTGELHVLTLTVFLSEGLILFAHLVEVECSDFSFFHAIKIYLPKRSLNILPWLIWR